MGRRRFVQEFVFSTVVAFVGNCSIRAAISIRHFRCLNVEQGLYSSNTISASQNIGCYGVVAVSKINAIGLEVVRVVRKLIHTLFCMYTATIVVDLA